MPESFIQLPTDGSGKKQRTWQDPVDTTLHDPFVRIAATRGGVFYVGTSDMISFAATANLRIWGLFNPAASGKDLWVHSIIAHLTNAAAATAVSVNLRRTSDTTTTGTVITPVRPDNGTVANVSACRALPTAGTQVGGNIGAAVTPATAGQFSLAPLYDFYQITRRQLLIPQGTGILWQVSGTPDVDVRAVVQAMWEEV